MHHRWKAGAEVTGAYDRADNKDFVTGDTLFADNYAVARFFGSCEINGNVEIYGRIENALDEQYEQTRGFEASGFGIFGGVRILLGK